MWCYLEINETILKFKLRVIQNEEYRTNAYNYILNIKNMYLKKILQDIEWYTIVKENDNTELRILYSIVLSYLQAELCYRNSWI